MSRKRVQEHGVEPVVGVNSPRLSYLRLLQLTTFVSIFDRFAMPPLIVAIAHDLGAPLSTVVHAAGAYFLAYGLMQPVWGMVSGALGLVRTMRLTLLLAAVATTTAAFTSTPLALGVARGIAGGFFGAAYPASLIYLGETVEAQRRQREIAQLMIGVAVGITLASVGAGLLAQVSWRAAFVVTGLATAALAVALRGLPEPPRTRERRAVLGPIVRAARSAACLLVLLLAFVEGAVLLGVLTLLPPAVQDAGASASVAGAVTGAYGIAMFASAGMVGRLSMRLHPAWLIGAGATALLTACVLLSLTRSPAVTVVVAVLFGLAWTSMHSSIQTWATEVVPDARTAVIALFAGALFAGSALAAVAVAGLAEAGEYGRIFLIATVTTVPLGLLATIGRARWRGPAGEAS